MYKLHNLLCIIIRYVNIIVVINNHALWLNEALACQYLVRARWHAYANERMVSVPQVNDEHIAGMIKCDIIMHAEATYARRVSIRAATRSSSSTFVVDV